MSASEKEEVCMRPFDKMSDMPGFSAYADLLSQEGIVFNDKMLQYKLEAKDGSGKYMETLIVLGAYFRYSPFPDNPGEGVVSANVLLAYGEKALIMTDMQWWLKDGEFAFYDAYDDDHGYWCKNVCYDASWNREVLQAFKAYNTPGADRNDYMEVLFGEIAEPTNTTSTTDPIKWMKWLIDDVRSFARDIELYHHFEG